VLVNDAVSAVSPGLMRGLQSSASRPATYGWQASGPVLQQVSATSRESSKAGDECLSGNAPDMPGRPHQASPPPLGALTVRGAELPSALAISASPRRDR
jgi:hypothetical protein